jgi:hypothetical protein
MLSMRKSGSPLVPMPLTTLAAIALVALALGGLALLVAPEATAGATTATNPPDPTPAIRSADALELGPAGVLFLADAEGAAVWALEVGTPPAASGEALEQIEDFDAKVAALLGVGPRDIRIRDMVVHEASGTAYLSVARGQGERQQPALVTVARDGALGIVDLKATPKSRLAIHNPPSEDTRGYRRRGQITTITDLEFIDGELFIAGLSNEEFASTLRRAPYPFPEKATVTELEIYHGAHGKYETHAPIFSFVPFDIDGETHLLAGYLCTPLVTFPLAEVKEQNRLRGKTIAELGWGNIPTDIVTYRHDGIDWVLVNNTNRGVMKLKAADIIAAQKRPGITSEVGPRTGLDDYTAPLGAVAQMDRLDADHVLILGRSVEDGSLYLLARETRWI